MMDETDEGRTAGQTNACLRAPACVRLGQERGSGGEGDFLSNVEWLLNFVRSGCKALLHRLARRLLYQEIEL